MVLIFRKKMSGTLIDPFYRCIYEQTHSNLFTMTPIRHCIIFENIFLLSRSISILFNCNNNDTFIQSSIKLHTHCLFNNRTFYIKPMEFVLSTNLGKRNCGAVCICSNCRLWTFQLFLLFWYTTKISGMLKDIYSYCLYSCSSTPNGSQYCSNSTKR